MCACVYVRARVLSLHAAGRGGTEHRWLKCSCYFGLYHTVRRTSEVVA